MSEVREGPFLYVLRWDVRPRASEYTAWTQQAIMRALALPGVQEMRVFQAVAGSPMVIVTFEFQNMARWSTWYHQPDVQALFEEAAHHVRRLQFEFWGGSPLVPDPVRKAGADPAAGHVLYLLRWDIVGETAEEYRQWVAGAVGKALSYEGVSGLRAYRAVAGSPRVVAGFEFPDLDSWLRWYGNPAVHVDLLFENGQFVQNTTTELWIPSPQVPAAVRPSEFL